MDIFSLFTMIGGLAFFLYGMSAMGKGLSKMAGGRMERILERLTSKKIYGLLLGAAVTAVIQSSSATTVMVVGFVNSGIMKLSQAVGVIMGANIGTTVTSWLLSLTGIEGSTILLKLLKPSSFSPLLAGIGIILILSNNDNEKKHDIGEILVGFAILMFGMETMSDAVAPLADNETFRHLFVAFSNPLIGMLAGAVLTAVIQSSSASVGILQALCLSGAVPYSAAIPIIMGQNIGTCITSIISSIGANRNARRASMIHLYFNVIGTTMFMIIFYTLNAFLHFPIMNEQAGVVGIAVIHSLFNITAAMVLFPFSDKLVNLATLTIPDPVGKSTNTDTEPVVLLDERFLDSPAFAMEICKNATYKMAREVQSGLRLSLELLETYDIEKAQKVVEYEQRVDEYEDVIDSYLVKLSSRDLSREDSQSLSILLHSISDFERISDHSIGIAERAKLIHDEGMAFSKAATNEIGVISSAVKEIIDTTVNVFVSGNQDAAGEVVPLELVVNRLTKEIKRRHVKRLRKGKCTIELGLSLEDILTVLDRVADHCANIALAILEIHDDEYNTHAYMDAIDRNDSSFKQSLSIYESKFALPEKKKT